MKRSKSLKIALMGASVLVMSACEEANQSAAVFKNVDECSAFDGMDAGQCKTEWATAQEEHVRVAPKYTSVADCETDFGEGQCETAPQQTTSGGSVFMPLMMGYMMGSMLSGGANNVATQPLYRAKDDPGNFRTGDNKQVSGKTGVTQVSRDVTRPASTKTSTVRRGGFGATAQRTATSTRSYGG